MPLKDLMEKNVHSVVADTKIKDVARLMKEKKVGAVVIVKKMNKVKKNPVGIVTDRDIVLWLGSEEEINLNDNIDEVMNHNVILARLSDGVAETIMKMKSNRINRIPVVDNKNNLVGIIDSNDLFRLLGNEIDDLSQIAQDNTEYFSKKKSLIKAIPSQSNQIFSFLNQ